jgi:U3 small nucleolar RNA-associated protein 20
MFNVYLKLLVIAHSLGLSNNDDRIIFLHLEVCVLQGVAGCGRLLFEVMHGVSGNFHSCADTMLPLVFEMLADKTVSQSLLYEVLSYMVASVVKFIQPKKGGLFWTSAFVC